MFSDGASPARRAAHRHSRRWRRFDLSAPRERNRAGRRRDAGAVLALLGARRASLRREREDVEVARQRLLYSRRPGARASRLVAAISPPVVALPQAAELHLGRDGAGGGIAATDD